MALESGSVGEDHRILFVIENYKVIDTLFIDSIYTTLIRFFHPITSQS